MTEDDISQVIEQFVAGAKQSFRAGFKGIELHGALVLPPIPAYPKLTPFTAMAIYSRSFYRQRQTAEPMTSGVLLPNELRSYLEFFAT